MASSAAPQDQPEAIVLSLERDILLGSIVIRPSAREVEGGGNVVSLEPRVMQVLVALARPAGAVVSRDELIDRCWEGRIVGDDAITRCIGVLRKLGRSCGDAFEIETLSKVGYRLTVAEAKPEFASVASALPKYDERGSAIAGDAAAPAPMRSRRDIWTSLWQPGRLGVAAVLIAVTIITLGFDVPNDPPVRWKVQRVQDFASTGLIERHPSFSPDGRMIAYSRGADFYHRKIFVQAIGSADPVQLTDGPLDESNPVWSPDGSQIAFLIHKDGLPCRIAILPFPKGFIREVGACFNAGYTRLDWSRSGKALVFWDRRKLDEPSRIVELDLGTGKTVDLTHPSSGEGDTDPVVSPDGTSILFARDEAAQPSKLVLLDLRSGAVRVLQTASIIVTGGWSPDSKTVFFAMRSPEDQAVISSMRPSDGSRSDLYISSTPIGRLVGAVGGWLAIDTQRGHFNVANAPQGEGATPQPLLPEFDKVWGATYASNGELAFFSARQKHIAVMVQGLDKKVHEIADLGPDLIDDVSWSRDGHRLALNVIHAGRGQIQIFGHDGLFEKKIDLNGRNLGPPGWLSAGRLLVPVQSDRWRLWEVDVDAGTAALAAYSDSNWDAVQVRGDEIYATRDGVAGLWRLDGRERLVSDAPPRMEGRRWKIFGDDVFYIRHDKTSLLVARRIGTDSERVVAPLPNSLGSGAFDINPLTATPVYLMGPSDTDIVLLRLDPN